MTEEELAIEALRYVTGESVSSDSLDVASLNELRSTWQELGRLPAPKPSLALRAKFYQNLNASSRLPLWRRRFVWQVAAAALIFVLGFGAGHFRVGKVSQPANEQPQIAGLRNQVEGLRQTVALSLMEKQSASSRLQGVEWSSQVDQPDQELLSALLTALNHDQNINVRLAALDALEKFTSNANVRKTLEQSIATQQSPLVQIALIDSLVHVKDKTAEAEFRQLSGNSAMNVAVRQRAQWALQRLSSE